MIITIASGRGGTGKTTVAVGLALNIDAALLLMDGLPGIGCLVIFVGADVALHVVEPTVSGVHDLDRVMAATDHLGVPSLVVVNKANINPAHSAEIAAFCAERGVELARCIPYDNVVTEAMV